MNFDLIVYNQSNQLVNFNLEFFPYFVNHQIIKFYEPSETNHYFILDYYYKNTLHYALFIFN
jgi:hypothetical protein